jgi:hypothetical protein
MTGDINAKGIYCIRNKQTGREYIGVTSRPFRFRWSQHAQKLVRGIHYNRALQRDWNRYPRSVFIFQVLEPNGINDTPWIYKRLAEQIRLYNVVGVEITWERVNAELAERDEAHAWAVEDDDDRT